MPRITLRTLLESSNASYFDFTMHKTWDQIFDGQSKDREDYQPKFDSGRWVMMDSGTL